MKVIFNADDFGLTSGINKAIIQSYREGVVRSTTIMANAPYYEEAVSLAKQNPDLNIGIHLVGTFGKPLLKTHKTLVDDEGNFKRFSTNKYPEIDPEEIFLEWCAQIDKVSQVIDLTHFDSHHHVHLHPLLFPITQRLSKKYNLPYRGRDYVEGLSTVLIEDFYAEGLSIETIVSIIDSVNIRSIDIMTHPGYVDDDLTNMSSYSYPRELELEILCSKQLKDILDEKNVEICSYKSIL